MSAREFITGPTENPRGYGEMTQDDVCAGSTRELPHLWDAEPALCRVCERRVAT